MRILKAMLGALAGVTALATMTAGLSVAWPSIATAEVRFGRNVRVGGHDFSNQRFDRKRRGEIYLYDHAPARPGCVWRSDGRGGKVKTCHLRRVR